MKKQEELLILCQVRLTVNGKVRRVSEGIFVAAPKNIDITGDTMKEHVKNGMDWNFM